MITSKDNKAIKNMIQLRDKAKARREQDAFIAEGLRMVLETPSDLISELYLSEKIAAELEQATDTADNVRLLGLKNLGMNYEILSDSLMKYVSGTETPQGVLAIVKKPHYEITELLQGSATQLLILENIQDPGNLGTMIRTAEGAGMTGIIMTKDTVDVFSPKVVRSTMGSLYRMPIFITNDLHETMKYLQQEGVSLYAAHLKGQQCYDQPDYTKPTGFLVGNEGNGLKEDTAMLCDTLIKIPMQGSLESLNAAMAAGILMYESSRQRCSR